MPNRETINPAGYHTSYLYGPRGPMSLGDEDEVGTLPPRTPILESSEDGLTLVVAGFVGDADQHMREQPGYHGPRGRG